MAKKIKLDLSQFKASGVYTLEFDASESILLTSNIARLVVGFSNVGPFNTPVFIPDVSTALQIFGDIDKTLENQGSYFHRSIFTCLLQGPVFALNLLKLDNSVDENGNPTDTADVADYRSYSVDTEEKNSTVKSELYSRYYNTQKFWYADTNYFLNARASQDDSKLLNFVNLGKQNMSILIRKSTDAPVPLSGFDIFAIDWYGANNLPSFINPYDYISDYFLDVFAIAGNWTNYQALSVDPVYKDYFTPQGFIKARLNDFLNLPSVTLINSVTGCIIPDFVDQTGANQYLQTLINAQTPATGLFCAVNEVAFDNICSSEYSKIDLVGHHLIDELGPNADITGNKELDFISYKQNLLADSLYSQNVQTVFDTATGPTSGTSIDVGTLIAFDGATADGSSTSNFAAYNPSLTTSGYNYIITATGATGYVQSIVDELAITSTSPADKFLIGKVTGITGLTGGIIPQFAENDLVKLKIENVSQVGGQARIAFSHPLITPYYQSQGISVAPYAYAAGDNTVTGPAYLFGVSDYFDIQTVIQNGGTGYYDSYVAYEEADMYLAAKSGSLTDNDLIWLDSTGTTLRYMEFTKSQDRDGFSTYVSRAYTNELLTLGSQDDVPAFGTMYASNNVGNPVDPGQLDIISLTGSINQYYDVYAYISENTFEVKLDANGNSPFSVGDNIVSTDLDICIPVTGNRQNRLARITEVSRTTNSNVVRVKSARPILYYGGTPLRVQKFKSIPSFTTNFTFTNLPGFRIQQASKPNGTTARQDEILDVLYETNLATTLALKEAITFRYIVDTFVGQIKPSSKDQYSRLAKARGKCLALVNAPSMAQFAASLDPRFTDAPTLTNPDPNLRVRYIADGGNLSLNPSFTFSLPTEELGSKYVGFFGPYITVRENNRNLQIPPAAYVSNNYVVKFGNGLPYSIVAGKKRGIIAAPNVTGVEYDLTTDDRGYLETFGINPIIRIPGAGVVIYGNDTAYQTTNSAFNLLHVRDLLISVETDIEDILSNYVFDFNEDSIRLEIKTLVDNYLDSVQAGGGIYAYQTIMDASNNPPSVIDQNIGIIDIIVEPARGIQKFVNRITVTRTGGIASGGFIQFA